MDKLLELLTLDDLDGNDLNLAEVIGIDAFRRIVKTYGGATVYIPKADGLILPLRNDLIIREYDGTNIFELSRKWGLTERRIQDIVREKSDEIRNRPIEGQTTFY